MLLLKKKPGKKATKQKFLRLKRTLEIILPSVALKAPVAPLRKQCAAVRTINSLMIDPAQKALHFPALRQ